MLAVRTMQCRTVFHRTPCPVFRNLSMIVTNPAPNQETTTRTTTATAIKSKSICAHCTLTRSHHRLLNSFHNGSGVVSMARKHLAGSSTRWSSSSSGNSSSKQQVSGSAVEEDEFLIFYTFPYVRLVRFLARLKIYQTFFAVVIAPSMAVMYTLGHVQLSQVFLSCGTATFAAYMLYIISRMCMRVAGYLSLSKDGSTLRVSHMDFWGNRKDSYIPVEEVVPICDTSETVNDVYLKLIQHDSKDVYFYSLRYGKVKDKDALETVFGQIM